MKTEKLYEPCNEAPIEISPESGKKTVISVFAALLGYGQKDFPMPPNPSLSIDDRALAHVDKAFLGDRPQLL